MKKTIRQSCFETNSSSTHSISIGEGKLNDTIGLNPDGTITLIGGKFGWGREEYNDAYTKANYLAVDAFGNEELMERLKRIIMEYTGATEVIIDFTTEDWSAKNHSYIDHQSNGTGNDVLRGTDDEIKQFLFCTDSELIIDDDNY